MRLSLDNSDIKKLATIKIKVGQCDYGRPGDWTSTISAILE